MRILFLVYHGFSAHSGISKKIHYQVKGLRENGHDVRLCYYDFDERGHRCRFVDGTVLKDYGTGVIAAIRQRLDDDAVYDYCMREHIEFVYARCFMNASPWLIRLFKKLRQAGVKSVTEIPTYPYDQEFTSVSDWNMKLDLWLDKRYRCDLYRQQNALVTFSDAEEIFGQRTIRISNGVDFDSIPLHSPSSTHPSALHFIGVAEVHFWHGFDRLVAGLGEYYRNGGQREVYFHIVGGVHPFYMNDMPQAPGFQTLIDKYGIQDKVIFHGTLFGDALTDVFNQCQFAIGSLARHRSGITVIKTLKNREYATRGIPFIYSEQDSDFDHQPYVLKAPADESPIDIQRIIDFVDTFQMKPEAIRKSVEHLAWKIQMQQVVDAVLNTSMHILYIYSEITIMGGTDKVLVEKANYLASHGYRVTIVTEAQMGRPLSFPLESAVRHIDIGLDFNSQYTRGTLGRAKVYFTLIRQYQAKLKRVLYEERPDIVSVIVGRSLDFIGDIHDGSVKIAEAHTTKPCLRSYHLLEQRGGLYKFLARYLRWKMSRNVAKLEGIVLLTQQEATDWKEAKQTFVIPNFITFYPKESAKLENKQVIMVGRYNDAKGYNYMISAWEIVHQRHPDWVLNAYGSGELHNQVIQWISERNLEHSFILNEPTSHIKEKYMDSSICVLSSRYEGFSLVILEAMACGVPVVSFDCPYGPRHIINDGEDGILVEPLNSQALADEICKLIENEELRKSMGENAHRNILRFSKDAIMKQWEELFSNIL